MEINAEPEKNQEISLKKTMKKLVSEHPEMDTVAGALVMSTGTISAIIKFINK